MTNRVTLQFSPIPRSKSKFQLEYNDENVSMVDESSEDISVIYLKDGSQFEALSNGVIRYSINPDELEDTSLLKKYKFAKRFIQNHRDNSIEYDVLLLLSGGEPTKVCSDLSEEIQELGSSVFHNQYPHFSEIGDGLVKLSFRQSNTNRIRI